MHTGIALLALLVMHCLAAGSMRGQTAGVTADSYGIAGVVTDTAGLPIADTEIALESSMPSATIRTQMTRTAADGTFAFAGVVARAVSIRTRRLGFRPYSMDLLLDSLSYRRPVRITLHRAAVELAEVRVDAAETANMRDFLERRRRRGSGHFIARIEIERRRPVHTSDVLRAFPGVLVRPSARFGNVVRIRGGCRPSIWVDGVQAVNAELDEVTTPGDIEGIEVYGSWAGIPPQYNDRTGKGCGAILVWTRIR